MKKNKKILFITFGDIPYDQRMQRIWSSLFNTGYDIYIASRCVFPEILIDVPYHVSRIQLLFKKGPLAYFEFNIRVVLLNIFRRFDLIYAADLDTLISATILSSLKRKPLIYDAHEYFTETPEVIRRPLIKKVWEWIAKFTIPCIDAGITVSETYASEFTKKYRKNFIVIRNAPSSSNLQKLSDHNKEHFLLYQGAINEGRGISEIITAIKDTKYQFKIAGTGDLENELKQLVIRNNQEQQVEFLGNLTPQKLKQLTGTAWIGLNLLENSSLSYYYSLANKFFDYMHAGLPQICIDFPEYRILNNQYKNAVLIRDMSPESILSAIYSLENKQFYQELEANAFYAAKVFNWNTEQLKLIDLIQNQLAHVKS